MSRAQYVLYVDESGDFESRPDAEGISAAQKMQSQLVGVLLPDRPGFGEGVARDLLDGCYSDAGITRSGESHAMHLSAAEVDRLALAATRRLSMLEVQPVRLVNRPRIDYGSHDRTYTRLFAELLLACFATLSEAAESSVRIRVIAANVVRIVDGQRVVQGGRTATISPPDYVASIRDALAFVAARQGQADAARNWYFGGIELLPARRSHWLQICDLLSNASFRDFAKLKPVTAKRLSDAYGDFDYNLRRPPLLEQAERALRRGDLGLCGLFLLETFLAGDSASDDRELVRRWRDAWGELDRRKRRSNSQLILATMQSLERQRRLALGIRSARWLLESLVVPLGSRGDLVDPEELLEFEFELRRWLLTLLNHEGRVIDAKTEADRIGSLSQRLPIDLPQLPQRLDAQIVMAVNATDRLDYAVAIDLLEDADATCLSLQKLLGKSRLGAIRLGLRARVLSTWSQAEMVASCDDRIDAADRTERLRTALALNCLAEPLHGSDVDQSQCLQYRAQIATEQREWMAARVALSRALSLAGDGHGDIAGALAPNSFPLLHWLRLGARLLRGDAESAEASEFRAAWSTLPCSVPAAEPPQEKVYPVHAILRHGAVLHALNGQFDAALAWLKRIDETYDPAGQTVLGMIAIAAWLEVTAVSQRHSAEREHAMRREISSRVVDCTRNENATAQIGEWLKRVHQLVEAGDPFDAEQAEGLARVVVS